QGDHARSGRAVGRVRLRRPSARLRGAALHPRRRVAPDYTDRPGRGGGVWISPQRERGRFALAGAADCFAAFLPADARLPRTLLARMADAQTEGDASRPRRTSP